MRPAVRRGRKADPPTDRTPFDARTVDVEARTGFLLRHNREYGRNPDISTGPAMVAALQEIGVGAGPADISNWERGTTPAPGRVLEAYEELTGATPGSLRGITETMRRCYHATRVAERKRDQQVVDLDTVTARCAAVFEGTPRGIDWLHFADVLAKDRVVLPRFLVDEPFARLVSEMNRSVGVAYLTRYEALASVLDSRYAEQARAAVHTSVFDEHSQVVLDAIVVLGESPDPERLIWLTELLGHPRADIVRGAALAIDNALETGRVDEDTASMVTSAVIESFVDADAQARRAMASVIRAVPQSRMPDLLAKLDEAERELILAVPGPRTDRQRAPFLAIAAEIQRAVSGALGRDDPQPLLTRLIYEALFEERAARRFHALAILKAVPYHGIIAEENARIARAHPDAEVRRYATDALLHFGHAGSADAIRELLDSDDVAGQRGSLVASAHSRIPLGSEVLRPMLTPGNPLWGRAFYSAGMNGDPVVAEVAEDPDADPELRGAARWWLREGRAVLD